MISNDDAASGLTILPEKATRRIGTRATALTAAALLVGTAGVATALFRSASSDRDPATLIPANAFAVATADLSLPGGQADALETLLGRFPGVHLTGDGSIRDRLLRSMLQSAQPAINYDSDVKPWLGDHVAIAGWSDNGKAEMEVVLQSTDDSSARQHLAGIVKDNGHVEMHDGYAVVGNSQNAVDDAIAAADRSSLHDSASYAGDINALPASEAITAWIDGPQAQAAISSLIPGGADSAIQLSPFGMLSSGQTGLFKGREALGIHVTDTTAELNARTVGASSTSSAPATMLTALPSSTLGAIEFANPGAIVDAATPIIRLFGSFQSSATSCYAFGGYAPYPGAVPALSPKALRRQLEQSTPSNVPHRRAVIRRILREERNGFAAAQSKNHSSSLFPSNGVEVQPQCTSTQSAPTDPLADMQKLLGISFPDDVKTVLGQRAVVAFGGLELTGVPDVAIRTHPTDLTSAQSLANTMASKLSSSPLHIDVSTTNGDLVLATSPSYGQDIATGGDLGGQDQAKAALGDMPTSVDAAGFVDLSRIWPLLGGGVPDGVKHLHAVGFWASTDGAVQTGQLRVVFG